MDSVGVADDGPTDAQLRQVVEFARLQVQRQRRVDELTRLLKTATTELEAVSKHDLPNLMDEIGIAALPLRNGAVIEVNRKIVANIKEEDRPAAHEWLDEHGYGSLIKHVVEVRFGKGDWPEAASLLSYLRMEFKKFPINDKESVHPQTLNAFVREYLEKQSKSLADGDAEVEDLPSEIKVTELRESKITLPKEATELWPEKET